MSKLSDALAAGRFTVTAELGAPLEPDPGALRASARALAAVVTAANVTDNPAATAKMSPLVCAALALAEGLEPILQLTGRDRNLLALQSELLGAWALGVRSVLALTGDPLEVGRYAGLATAVRDVDSAGLSRLIAELREGRLAAGEQLQARPDFLIAAAANPLIDTLERLEGKVAAGAGLLQSNIVYDVKRFAAWLAPIAAAGVTERAPLLVGVSPPRSTRALRHMHDNVPGVEVDPRTFAEMEGLDGDAAKQRGAEIAARIVIALREVPGVAGVHLIAPGWEAEAVPRVAQLAGL